MMNEQTAPIPSSPFSDAKRKTVLTTGAAAVAVAGILMAAKTWAYFTTGSVAVLSSVFDSGIDLMMSAITLLSLRYSLTPPDDEHRHGHGKIEGITALIQGVLMLSCGGILGYEGFLHLISGTPVSDATTGVIVMVLSIILSVALVRFQSKTVQSHHSLAIEADKGHYSADVYMNAGTIAVLLIAPLTGWHILDPLFAIGIAAFMAWTAYGIGRKSFAMLLDEEVEGPIKERVEKLIVQDPNVKSMHDLRITRSGMRLMISFDVEIDGNLTLKIAHNIAVAAEDRILAEFPHAEVLIHLDPEHEPHDRRHAYHMQFMRDSEDIK